MGVLDNGVRIRPIRSSDYLTVMSVLDGGGGGRHMADLLPRLFFEHFTDTSFAAERDGELAGFLVGFRSQSRPGEAYIHFVGVDPELRGRGVGRELYTAFLRRAAEAGRREVRAITSPGNTGSVAFHRAMGFTVEPGDREVDGLSVHSDYDGPGQHRVCFLRRIADSPSRQRA